MYWPCAPNARSLSASHLLAFSISYHFGPAVLVTCPAVFFRSPMNLLLCSLPFDPSASSNLVQIKATSLYDPTAFLLTLTQPSAHTGHSLVPFSVFILCVRDYCRLSTVPNLRPSAFRCFLVHSFYTFLNLTFVLRFLKLISMGRTSST